MRLTPSFTVLPVFHLLIPSIPSHPPSDNDSVSFVLLHAHFFFPSILATHYSRIHSSLLQFWVCSARLFITTLFCFHPSMYIETI